MILGTFGVKMRLLKRTQGRAIESSECCQRVFCKANRSFTSTIHDAAGAAALLVQHLPPWQANLHFKSIDRSSAVDARASPLIL